MGIGKDGKLFWKLLFDLKLFKDIIIEILNFEKKNVVIMGRKIWESIFFRNRFLRSRFNVVFIRFRDFDVGDKENVVVCGSMDFVLELLSSCSYSYSIDKVFIIGGG